MAQTGDMPLHLKLVLDATPDAVWAALQSPSVLAEVAHPIFSFEPLSPRGPAAPGWPEGRHPLFAAGVLWGMIPAGEQVIDIRYRQIGDARIVEDAGGPVSGILSVVSALAPPHGGVAQAADGRTLYRDRLDISAGVLTPLVWIGAWAFWQWRGFQLTRLAPRWRAAR